MKRAFIVFGVCLAAAAVLAFGPFGMEGSWSTSDSLFLALIVAHTTWGASLLRKRSDGTAAAEALFSVTLVLFLFSYIYALNANMDYVQRFAQGSGSLRLAPDSTVQRLNAVAQYGPFLLLDAGFAVAGRTPRRTRGAAAIVSQWAPAFAITSALLYTLALPSFARIDGAAPLAYIALLPTLLVLRFAPPSRAVFCVILFGVLQTMLTNFWLGTFSLVSLQFITVVYFVFFALFALAAVAVARLPGAWGVLVLPAVLVGFDSLRSAGFLGYPWGMLGASQYAFLPLIQVASVTGVWGVTFLVAAANATAAFALIRRIEGMRVPPVVGAVCAGTLAIVVAAGAVYLGLHPRSAADAPHAVVALVQQNTDPRKDDYREGLDVLKRLTDSALPARPDLVVWSETTFVPNIRRWSAYEPSHHQYAALVHDFLGYQRSIGTWLMTGNDDYTVVRSEDGREERFDYNASILFDPAGNRVQTYHKIHLVPFTEHFPFADSMPRIYELLLNFDVYLWEPGDERVVFRHPLFSFATPICFEDSFPEDVRAFVRAGAEAIINLSNDYWSLSPVEAKQHYVNAVFRAVENRRDLLRASASGVTSHVDEAGRLLDRLPYYEEGVLVTRLPLLHRRTTLYTRLGDWFPAVCLAATGGALAAAAFFGTVNRKRRAVDRGAAP